jgi:ribosome-associated protein
MESAQINLAPGITIDRSALRYHFARSGGPGGQNVNKVNSKAELRIRPEDIHGLSIGAEFRLRQAAANRITSEGDLLIVSDTSRTQEANRKACIDRLSALVMSIWRDPKIRKKSRPSRGSVQRRIDDKKARSKVKKERSRDFGY